MTLPSHIAAARQFGRLQGREIGLFGLLVFCLTCAAAVIAQTASSPSSTMHSRTQAVTNVVLGIVSYTQWPVRLSRLQLCVLAQPLYAGELLHGERMSGDKKIVARSMAIDDPDLGRDCNVVYLGAITAAQRLDIFERLSGHHVLSISEADPTCAAGSMFCLYVEEPDKVRFKINLDSVARSGLRIDPHVLLLSHAGKVSRP